MNETLRRLVLTLAKRFRAGEIPEVDPGQRQGKRALTPIYIVTTPAMRTVINHYWQGSATKTFDYLVQLGEVVDPYPAVTTEGECLALLQGLGQDQVWIHDALDALQYHCSMVQAKLMLDTLHNGGHLHLHCAHNGRAKKIFIGERNVTGVLLNPELFGQRMSAKFARSRLALSRAN